MPKEDGLAEPATSSHHKINVSYNTSKRIRQIFIFMSEVNMAIARLCQL